MTVVVEVLLRASGNGLDDRVAKRLQAMFCGDSVWADRPFCVSRCLAASAWARDGVLHFYMRPLGARAKEVEGAVRWFVHTSHGYGAGAWEGDILVHGAGQWLQNRVAKYMLERWHAVGYDIEHGQCFLRVKLSPMLANMWDLYGALYKMAQRYSLLVRPLRALGIRCETQ